MQLGLFSSLRSIDDIIDAVDGLGALPLDERVSAINRIREAVHSISPFRSEPVDCVKWIKADKVHANDYNPNSVAPPEMRLLEHSIEADGYTQPIVAWPTGDTFEVIDGFHRHRVGKESQCVAKRVHGYLPLAVVNSSRTDRNDRIASTIRHNRARGKHKVEAMSDIVVELKRRNWSDDRIAKELGMDPDEVLRLCQITGLAELFQDSSFSEAWESSNVEDWASVLVEPDGGDEQQSSGRRILHTWDKWECYRSGFFADRPPGGMSQEDGERAYADFLSNTDKFDAAMQGVISGWKHSCEHHLTNDRMNRIAWLGQASVAYALQIPAVCRGGFNRLSEEQQGVANEAALMRLNEWLRAHGMEDVSMAEAMGRTDANLY